MMASIRFRAVLHRLASFMAVPWGAFVAVFLYAVVLTMVAIGVDQVSDGFMAVAYGAPVVAYVLVLMARGVRALAALPMRFDALPERKHAVLS